MNLILGTQSTLKLFSVEMIIKEFRKKQLFKEIVSIIPKSIQQTLRVTPLEEETYEYAKKRAEEMFKLYKTEGEFFVGVENGLIKRFGKIYEECWCVVIDLEKNEFSGFSSGIQLPKEITDRMSNGELHHEVMMDIAKDKDSRQTWGIYTNGVVLREKSIEEAFRNAFYYAITYNK